MLLKELSEAPGVSGAEDAVRKIILDAIDGHAQDIRIDAMGGVTAVKPGTGNKLRVMFAAHMDEVGFMVTGVDSSGLVKFTAVGGIDDRILPGLRVKIGATALPGVVLWKPIHKGYDQDVVKISSLRIDIGADSKESANGKVKPGDRIVFDSTYMELSATMLRGKAFDDRVGCALLVAVLQGGPYPVDICAAFTVQEEIGLRGAKIAAHYFKPDVAFALEGTTAHDVPNPLADPDDMTPLNPTTRLGAGPALTVMDASMIAHPGVLRFMRQTADKYDIPYQLKTRLGGGTDAGSIHQSGVGVPSGVISVPCRYIHSPAALLNRHDYDNTRRLLQSLLNDISADALRYE